MKKKTKKKPVYFAPETLHQNHYFMMAIPCWGFVGEWPRRGLGNHLKFYASDFKNGVSRMIYRRREFDKQADFLASKILKNPAWALALARKIERNSSQFFKFSKIILKTEVKKLNNQELVSLLLRCSKPHFNSHIWGASITWHADAEKERFSKGVIAEIDKLIKFRKLRENTAEVFSILSTPSKYSFGEREEKEFLELAIKIYENKKLINLFKTVSLGKLGERIKKENPLVFKKIQKHVKKYEWLTYMYTGPVYSQEDFLLRWQNIFKSKQNSNLLLRKFNKKWQDIQRIKEKLFKKLKPKAHLKKLIA